MDIRIGGVPEHFNYPWHYAFKKGYFHNQGINLIWKDFPSGTGAMCASLKSAEVDLALVLTEGIVAEVSKGNDLTIVSEYVSSPLLWGIHVPYNSSIETEADIKGKTYAISRYGSGSHLMAFVDALKRGWSTDNLSFQIVNNIDGARNAFKNGEAEVFFWEKFTTKPLVDNKEFKRVGVRPTPWPCFLLAGRKEFVETNRKLIENVVAVYLKAIQEITLQPAETIEAIAKEYNLEEADIKEWYSITKWSKDGAISSLILNEVSDILMNLKIIENAKSPLQLCSSITKLVQ